MDDLANLKDAFWYNANATYRITKKLAQQLLLNNESIIVGGCLYYFLIKDLGLGVCSVSLHQDRVLETYVYKEERKPLSSHVGAG